MKRRILLALLAAPVIARAQLALDDTDAVAAEFADRAGGQATVQPVVNATLTQVVRPRSTQTQTTPAEAEQIVDHMRMAPLQAPALRIQAIPLDAYVENFNVGEMKYLKTSCRLPVGRTPVAGEPVVQSRTLAKSTTLIGDVVQQAVATRSHELRQWGAGL